MRTRNKFIVGVSAGLLASCAFGAAANAAPAPAGQSLGLTAQQAIVQTAAASTAPAVTGAETSAALYILGSDGHIYNWNGSEVKSPAGLTFTSISASQTVDGSKTIVMGIASDGSLWVGESVNNTMTKIPLPAGVKATQTSYGEYALGSDGQVYFYSGRQLVSQSGQSYTSISASQRTTGAPAVLAIGVDGLVYASDATNTSLGKSPISPQTATATAEALYFLGTNGQVYRADGVQLTAPAGVTFKSISGDQRVTASGAVLAIATDGTVYQSNATNTALVKAAVPVPAVQTAAALYALGTDGNIYRYDGVKMSAPAGVTFTSISADQRSDGTLAVLGITPDGTVYQSNADGTLTPIVLPQALVVTSPTAGTDYANDGKVPFTGTGVPGATITVKDANGDPVCTTAVAGDGTWSCQPDAGALNPDPNAIIKVEQNNKGTITTTTIALNVGDPLVGPIVEPGGLLLLGLFAAAGLGTAGALKIRSRRIATQAAPQA